MGYDIHITRADFWIDSYDNEITAQEWIKIIEEDPELIKIPENGAYFVIWRGTSRYPETWFNWENGYIYTTWPDKATFRKMYQIAQKLNAQLQGEEGEIYDSEWIDNFDDSFYDRKEFAAKPEKEVKKTDNGIKGIIKRILKKMS